MCVLDPMASPILRLANTTGSAGLDAANRTAPQATGLATGNNIGYAQGYGTPQISPARRNEIGEAGAFARPTPQVGEGAIAGSGGFTGALAKNADGNYSVYWPGLNNTQLEEISEEVRRLIAKSDTLKQQLRDHKDVQIIYGPTKGGTKYEFATNTITIAAIKRDDAKAATRSLAHEMSHIDGPEIDRTSIQSYLNSEGAAQIGNTQIRNEISDNGGEDIGIGGSKTNQAIYTYICNKYMAGQISYEKAIKMIGDIYGDKEHPSADPERTYRRYYYNQGAR